MATLNEKHLTENLDLSNLESQGKLLEEVIPKVSVKGQGVINYIHWGRQACRGKEANSNGLRAGRSLSSKELEDSQRARTQRGGSDRREGWRSRQKP